MGIEKPPGLKAQIIGKPQMLKEVNSSVIERLIYEQGPLSKPELAKLTRLSLPTVSKLVDALEKNTRLCQAGRTGKGAGRKAVLYETNRNSGCILVLYYYLGTYRCRIADMLSKTLYEAVFPLDSGNAQRAVDSTLKAIDTLTEHAPTKVKAIGIGMPGVVRPDGGLMGIPQIAAWEGFNLEKLLSQRYKAKICVENLVKLSAVGYYHTRLREKPDNIVYIYVGNGMGAGLILNKQLYRGSGNSSGEIGFMSPQAIPVPLRDYTIKGGFMETHLGKFVDYSRGDFRQGDPKEREEAVKNLSMIVVNHVAILNPEVIVFGGSIFNDTLLEDVKRRVSAYIPAEFIPQIRYDDSSNTGIEGLTLICRSYLTTEMQLVQNRGRIRRQASPA
jgi:predicted NBD/HSP70 family sugar kinase